MNHLDLQVDMFLRSLTNCMEHNDISTRFDLQLKAISLRDAIHEHFKEMESRITENVLKAISIKFESGDALKEIKPLKNAINSLVKFDK